MEEGGQLILRGGAEMARSDSLPFGDPARRSASLLFVPIIGARSFVVRIVLVPVGRDVLFYGAAALRSSMPLGDRRSREESLSNRLAAMTDWLGRQLEAAQP